MATQTLNLGNFGASGFMPDVPATLLPQTGFSYARNWRFEKGGDARVTDGYSNAFNTRSTQQGPYLFGETTTDLTFLYTWELSDNNAVVTYDSHSNRLIFTENDTLTTGLTEHQLSVNSISTYTHTYSTGTPTSGQFNVNATGHLILTFGSASDATTARATFTVGDEISIVTSDKGRPEGRTIFKVLSTSISSATVTVVLDSALNSSAYAAGTSYVIRTATPIEHDSLAAHKWEGTDALGVPVFNNELEAPWEFVDAPNPYVQQMTSWPNSNAVCKQLTSFGSVLVAVGYTDSSTGAGAYAGSTRTLAFSNPITSAGTLPTWTFSSLTSEAQLIDLSLYTDGDLVGAYESNGVLIVNSTTDVMTITDNGDGTYSAQKLEIGGGVLSKRTSVPVSNGFFNIGNGQFYIHDTNTYQDVGHGVYSQAWFSSVDTERLDEIQVIYDPRTRTVWIKTPTSSVAQEIWIINLENNYTLSVLDGHDDIAFMEWSAEGTPAVSTTWDTLEHQSWDSLPQNTWNEFPVVELGEYRNRILSCGGRKVFVHDFGDTFDGVQILAVLEKSYFKLGAQDSHSTFQFDRVIPWVSGPVNTMIDVRVGSANTVSEPVSNTPYQTYSLGVTDKLDFRRQARWGSITFRCSTPDVRLSGVEISINSANRR